MSNVTVFVPLPRIDALADALRWLTEQAANAGAPTSHGLFGGEHGYGATIDRPTFRMHPFCWCDRDDCPYCGGCTCPESAFHYFTDGKEVDYAGWLAFFTSVAERSGAYRGEDADEANRRRSERHDPVCDHCLGKGIWGPFQTSHGTIPGKRAPLFWHKPSGLRVWWYKYIGRDMEVHNPSNVDPVAIINQCGDALNGDAAGGEGRG